MKLPPLRSMVLTLIGVAIIAAFIYYLYANADQYLQLLHLSGSGVLMLLSLSTMIPFIAGLMNVYMFQSLGTDLRFRDAFLLAASSTLANLLPLPAGVMTRGFYLKRKYSLSYTRYFSAMAALYIYDVVFSGILGLAVLAFWFLSNGQGLSVLLWIGFGSMAASQVIFWLPLERLPLPHSLRHRLQQAMEGWTLIGRNPGLLIRLLGLHAAVILVVSMRYWLAFHMLSQNVSLSQALLFANSTVLTVLVSLAPGGVGVREAIVAAVSSALGFPMAASVAAIGLDRLIETLTIVVIGWIGMVVLGKQVSDLSMGAEEQNP